MEATNFRLKSALEATRLDRLVQRFADEGVGDDILDQLGEADLEKLGVTRMGDRKRLISIFRKIFYNGVTGTAMVEVKGGILPGASELKGTTVKTFLIGKYPVLQEDWEWVRVWGICNGYDLGAGQASGSFAPVTHVNWYDAVKWCNAKSEHDGIEPPYTCEGGTYRKGEFGPSGSKLIQRNPDSTGYRLPLEAEWEWAAIGGLLHEHGLPPQVATTGNGNPQAGWRAHREPIFNELGIYNMTSNVWEWCWDHDDVQTAHRIRSGALTDYGEKGLSPLHISHSPDSRLSVLGFRLARNA
ncbi:MAG: SUMF1/EgtB/PvdO family nonheme iron enzyme [Verrucomicrobia bacterium]|nr:SUMF1/EgtB/PvdO family nonheme iron enzyme [Verrucomicrobiota bacterium]